MLTFSKDSLLFLTSSLILLAILLYLPSHVSFIFHRAFYYYSGNKPHIFSNTSSALQNIAEEAQARLKGTLSNATSAKLLQATQSVISRAQELAGVAVSEATKQSAASVPVAPEL